jgi:hypothetical protein
MLYFASRLSNSDAYATSDMPYFLLTCLTCCWHALHYLTVRDAPTAQQRTRILFATKCKSLAKWSGGQFMPLQVRGSTTAGRSASVFVPLPCFTSTKEQILTHAAPGSWL